MEIARSTRRSWLEAQELAALAEVLRSLGRREEAEAIIPRALDAARDAGLQYHEARMMCLSGALASDRGDLARARADHDEGLRISQEARDLEGEAYARTGLTETGLCQGPFDRAIEDGVRARRLWLRLGHRPMADSVAQTLGHLRLLMGDVTGAGSLLDVSLKGARELGMRRDEPFPLVGLCLVAAMAGDLGRALADVDVAVETADSQGEVKGEIASRLCRALLLQELGAPEGAVGDLDALDDLAPDASYLRPIRLSARAWLQLAEGERETARATFARARIGAEGLLLSRIGVGRFEIIAWSAAGDRVAAADAAAWVLEGPVDACPGATALAGCALARADREGASAGSVLEQARRANDKTLLWRACLLASDEARKMGNAEVATTLREEAEAIVQALADSLVDAKLRSAYLADAKPSFSEVGSGDPEIR